MGSQQNIPLKAEIQICNHLQEAVKVLSASLTNACARCLSKMRGLYVTFSTRTRVPCLMADRVDQQTGLGGMPKANSLSRLLTPYE